MSITQLHLHEDDIAFVARLERFYQDHIAREGVDRILANPGLVTAKNIKELALRSPKNFGAVVESPLTYDFNEDNGNEVRVFPFGVTQAGTYIELVCLGLKPFAPHVHDRYNIKFGKREICGVPTIFLPVSGEATIFASDESQGVDAIKNGAAIKWYKAGPGSAPRKLLIRVDSHMAHALKVEQSFAFFALQYGRILPEGGVANIRAPLPESIEQYEKGPTNIIEWHSNAKMALERRVFERKTQPTQRKVGEAPAWLLGKPCYPQAAA